MQQQQPPQSRNLILFFIMAFLIYFAWMDLRNRLWPAKPEKPDAAVQNNDGKAGAGEKAENLKIFFPPPPTPDNMLRELGSDQRESNFHLFVKLDPRGAGVRSIMLNKFQAADELGRPSGKQLELIPEDAYNRDPSYLLYHFDVHAGRDEDRPVDTLGNVVWRLVGGKVEETTLEDGRKQQRAAFETEVQGFVVTKIFTLTEKDYHLGLEVRFKRTDNSGPAELPFRYQLTGGHGLPVEGKWYTNTFRNALIARIGPRESVYRTFQDLRQIISWEGGDKIEKEPGLPVRYFGVGVQYFASVIAVDDKQEKLDFLSYAQPTLDTMLAKGQVISISADHTIFRIRSDDRTLPPDQREGDFFVPPEAKVRFAEVQVGQRIAVIFRDGSYNPLFKHYLPLAIDWQPEETTHALWVADITVRATTDPVDLAPGKEVVHKYLLYNGPVKVSQLYDGQNVPPEVVDRYIDRLHLNTLTDYQSPGWLGSFSSTIGMTWVIIKCTNLMHVVLGFLHNIVPSYGLCIILLTVLVRGLMFPVSRKQQQTTMRMQQLAPELKKLQEKYKDNRQELAAAQMELYRKHGVNPFGTCWFLLLQMPIFMGLYYALQESIRFRLAPFWPTWVVNLAAPDMMIYWGERIPWISRPQDYGWLLYLGPFFNLLPVVAVGFMLVQQKLMTPPPTDDQQAMQMKIMRYMMIFMGLMFYKVAAGLCLYFIASGVWGLLERKFLPKVKPGESKPSSDGLAQRKLAPAAEGAGSGGNRRERARNRTRPGRGREDAVQQEPQGWWQRLRAWWQQVLEEAQKKQK
jgi:YidC/Oxa1 family membrane protein insertase